MEGRVAISQKNNRDIYEVISLDSYIKSFRDEEEMRDIFLNMDRAMKYIHDKGYCVGSFDPRAIEILNNSVNQIRFTQLMPLPTDYAERKKYIKEDIYCSSFIQIGLYADCLPNLRREFLKSNFDRFAQFLPEGDVPYYRGVIDRGASVYFCEYAAEKASRDLMTLQQEVAGEDAIKNTPPQKSMFTELGINDRINDRIYNQISGRSEAAFVSFLLFPTAILILGVVFALIAMIISYV